jgi:tetratricopeptide (TPR) repeat protein
MSKKHKRKGGGQRDFADVLLQQVRRELDKGNSRQALKDAKVLFRRDAQEVYREILEEAYVARAQQLQQTGLPEQARAVYDELMSLGVRTPSVQERLPRLQLLLGIAAQGPGGAVPDLSQADPQFLVNLADEAVLHPQRVAAAYAELKQQAERVRKALEAVERGDDPAATELLKDVPRVSPLAEWKLFARGLSAYYAQDVERMRANWDRLDPQRPAQRIAETLLVASGAKKAHEASRDLSGRLRRLEYAVQRDPTGDHLKGMARHLRAENWRELLQSFRTFRGRYGASHAELVVRVTDLLWKALTREGLNRELGRLMALAPGLPLDPHWHRARALCAEHPGGGNPEAAAEYWSAYVAELPQVTVLRDDERQIAAGLVELRQARGLVRAARYEDHPPPSYWLRASPGEARRLRTQALRHFEESLRRCPQLLAAYQELAGFHLEMEHPQLAAKTYKSLLRQFPENYEALRWLATYYLEEDQPGDAEPYVMGAARLRPRDPQTATLLWNQRIGMVRHCTRKRKFEQARGELEAAAANAPADVEPFWLDVTRATIEYKAQNAEAAQRHLDQATARLREPTPVWLAMHANAARYGLNREVKNDFGSRFKAAVTGPCTSQTAGQMAKYLATYLAQGVTYTGFVTHQRALRKYLERAERMTWEQGDLHAVCRYLMLDEAWHWRGVPMLSLLADAGGRRFPQDPHFPFWVGWAEKERGPLFCDLQKAIGAYQRALELNPQAGQPLPLDFVEIAKKSLSFLQDLHASRTCRPFDDGSDEDDDYDEEEDDGHDEDDDYDYDEEDDEDDEWYEEGPGREDAGSGFGARGAGHPLAQVHAMMRALGLDPAELARKLSRGEMSLGQVMDLLRRRTRAHVGPEDEE